MPKRWMNLAAFRWLVSCCPMHSPSRLFTQTGRITIAVCLLAGLYLTGCATAKRDPDLGKVISAIAKEDCPLCTDSLAKTFPWGQDNVGIFSLNTFEVLPIEINRYERNGALIKNNSGVLTMCATPEKETGFTTFLTVGADHGIAIGDCSFREDQHLDVEKAANTLCQSCLDQALSKDGTGVAVIDFFSRDFHPLTKATPSFSIGNYYIHCDWVNTKPGAKLYIFYTPLRYHERS